MKRSISRCTFTAASSSSPKSKNASPSNGVDPAISMYYGPTVAPPSEHGAPVTAIAELCPLRLFI